MKRQVKSFIIVIAVIAVLQIAGGTVYAIHTARNDKQYTYVDCTVVSVDFEEKEDNQGTINGITVSYVNSEGQTVVAKMADYPYKFSVGTVFRARYTDNPELLSAQSADWFTPVLMIVLGVAYAIGDVVLWVIRKKTGLYALGTIDDSADDDLDDFDDDSCDGFDDETDLVADQTENN